MGCLTLITGFIIIILLILRALSIITCAWIWCFSPIIVWALIIIFAIIIDKIREGY